MTRAFFTLVSLSEDTRFEAEFVLSAAVRGLPVSSTKLLLGNGRSTSSKLASCASSTTTTTVEQLAETGAEVATAAVCFSLLTGWLWLMLVAFAFAFARLVISGSTLTPYFDILSDTSETTWRTAGFDDTKSFLVAVPLA